MTLNGIHLNQLLIEYRHSSDNCKNTLLGTYKLLNEI